MLEEFAAIRDQPAVAALALTHFSERLAERAVWVGIGNRDGRVGTESCLRFAQTIADVEAARGCAASRFECHVVPEDGHHFSDPWHEAGGRYLLAMAST
ncbi:MAG: hypothetical protein CMJ49_07155 [Planctomycetaceae bacterium]|nr:hypothetical protein [Planctomycetaceae bacterium]